MPYKDPQAQKAAQAAWFQKNKEELARKQRDKRNHKRKFIEQYKLDNPVCKDCGISYPPHILDFDHLPEFNKSFQIGGDGINNKILDDIVKEIAKCEIVCSNCHRHRTWMRSKNNKRS